MASSMHTILIIGGTSGIGEAFAQRFHKMGKKVIVTGRRKERLNEMQKSMKGLEIYPFDMTDFASVAKHVETLFTQFTDIDSVWINGGIQVCSDIKDITSTTDTAVIDEITTNVTAPMILSRHIIPRLIAQKKETQLMITSSGLGFVPVGSLFPVYCPTKAAIHDYLVGVRQALKQTSVNVLELVPPFVRGTALVDAHAEKVKNAPAMGLQEFTDEIFGILETKQAKDLKEVAAGSAVDRVGAWRSGTGAFLEKTGLGG